MEKLEPGQKEKVGDLIRYYMKDGEKKGDPGVCPSYFNNVHKVGRIFEPPRSEENPPCDPYKLNSGLPEDHLIPEMYESSPNLLCLANWSFLQTP